MSKYVSKNMSILAMEHTDIGAHGPIVIKYEQQLEVDEDNDEEWFV